jgi:hypothetical protein
MAASHQTSLMLMERACARKWLEANPGLLENEAEFEQAVEDLALHIFHYVNGWEGEV